MKTGPTTNDEQPITNQVPNADEQERALAALLLAIGHDVYARAAKTGLQPQHFHTQAGRDIYRAAELLDADGAIIDHHSLPVAMADSGTLAKHGNAYLIELEAEATSAVRLEWRCQQIIGAALRRNAIGRISQLGQDLYGGEDVVESARRYLAAAIEEVEGVNQRPGR